MKEFRLRAFALKKITMLSATSPTFFSFKTFLIPLFLKRQCRKKRLKLRWGMILNLKKKSADAKDTRKENFQKRSKAR